jgi:putative SOS response-associated peptidase YedK
MCGRYAFFSPAEAVKRTFALDDFPAMEPRYNIAPTQPVPVLREIEPGRREVAMLHWGLIPSWAREKSVGNRMINARAETLAERPAFRVAFRRRRCVVLADGWYEWQAVASGKQPWFIHSRDGAPMGLAALWETWRDPAGGEPVESCAIVTTEALGPLADVHHRMPAVLPAAQLGPWLDPRRQDVAELSGILGPRDPAAFSARPVGRRVNDPRNQGAELIEAAAGA